MQNFNEMVCAHKYHNQLVELFGRPSLNLSTDIFSAVPGLVGLLHFGTFSYILQPFSQKISQVLLYLAFNSTF